jgi:signal transduction histidine kinase
MIQRLQQDCDRLAELMKSVLSFSHPTEYEMEAIDMRVFMERLIERMRPKITRANVKHLLQTEPATPLVRANPRALEQVFNNLITNALQAMDGKGGTLAIKIQPVIAAGQRRQVEVSVADSGPGIPKELLERIFQPFFTTKNNGTGLGLAITKRIITAHKGTIRVNSFPGGTVFQVLLPEYKQGGNTDLSDSQAFSNLS